MCSQFPRAAPKWSKDEGEGMNREALRRIEQAAAEGWEELDLAGLELTNMTAIFSEKTPQDTQILRHSDI